jgi:hypothetical protein
VHVSSIYILNGSLATLVTTLSELQEPQMVAIYSSELQHQKLENYTEVPLCRRLHQTRYNFDLFKLTLNLSCVTTVE